MQSYITKSEQETLALGRKIASELRGGEVFILQGDLGAGKTVLARGIAQGLKIKKNITSPTYLLMKHYIVPQNNRGIKNFLHFDAYRGADLSEFQELGLFEKIGQKDTITLIEWGIGFENYFKKNNIKIQTIIIYSTDKDERKIEFKD